MSRHFAGLAAAVMLIAGAGCNSSTTTPTPGPTPIAAPLAGWHVIAGSQDSTEAFQALPFYPSTITIDAGDTVNWTFPAGEPHTVSFPLPGASPVPPSDPTAAAPQGGTIYDGSAYVSSGFLVDGAKYALTFPTPGTYTYYSLPQAPLAGGKIVVQAKGTAYPQAQSSIDALAQSAITTDIATAQQSLTAFPYATSPMHIAAGMAAGLGAGPPANGTVMRFVTAPTQTMGAITVAVGTTVVWTNQANNVPHNVYFPIVGGQPPQGPPGIAGNGAATYDGTAIANSNVLAPGQSYSLTFTQAGTFKYYCLFHDDEGMTGTVIVQ